MFKTPIATVTRNDMLTTKTLRVTCALGIFERGTLRPHSKNKNHQSKMDTEQVNIIAEIINTQNTLIKMVMKTMNATPAVTPTGTAPGTPAKKAPKASKKVAAAPTVVVIEGSSPSKKRNADGETKRAETKCSNCGNSGHNRRRCPKKVITMDPIFSESESGSESDEETEEEEECPVCSEDHDRSECPTLAKQTKMWRKYAAKDLAEDGNDLPEETADETDEDKPEEDKPKDKPKTEDKPKNQKNKCSYCHEVGHSKPKCRTLKMAQELKLIKPQVERDETVHGCGMCGEEGHNRVTCRIKTVAEALGLM